jgi:DNA-binding HxlR family transcriptional regulator
MLRWPVLAPRLAAHQALGRKLERDGFVTRTQFATIPPHVEYALTPLGGNAAGLLGSIRDWAQENLVEVLTARALRQPVPGAGRRSP